MVIVIYSVTSPLLSDVAAAELAAAVIVAGPRHVAVFVTMGCVSSCVGQLGR
jgi:hypothetical protein